MSDPASALGHAAFDGSARVREIGPLGMILVRAAGGVPGLGAAVRAVSGADLPGMRGIATTDGRAVAWMSPDEWLILLPYGDVAAGLDALGAALAGQHALCVDVSDARAVFTVAGPGADAVLARLCPVDLARLPAGEMRRTRLAQVACALWRSGPQEITLVTFRSVARYAFDVLANAAR